jgi:transglutaminase-like putative cysteine protease
MKSGKALSALQFGLAAASVCAAVLPHLLRMPWLFVVPIVLVLYARCQQRLRGGTAIPAWIKLPLVLIFPVLIIFHFGTIFGREPGSVLACAMLVLKLVETDTRRDARAAVCFSSFVLMSALLFDSNLGFTLLLVAALCIFLAALRELETAYVAPPGRSPSAAHAIDGQERPWQRALQEDLRGGALALAAAVPLALCVFLFFPRLGSPLWGTPSDAGARTGLGDSMAPGTIQELLVDDTPAFRVSFIGPAPPRSELYWRGPVLWQFDGSAWRRPELLASSPGGVDLKTQGPPIGYEVMLEPTQRRWLLALDVPLSAPEGAVRGADMSLVSRGPVDGLLRYDVVSSPHYVLEAELDPEHKRLALQLPDGFDPQARELAQRWRMQFRNTETVVRAALKLFHDEFSYTLNAPLLARDSVDDFLFGTKQGFCEHFASAFTFLMRAAGVPARVVSGYQGGYYNKAGDYWVVRQSDAHAWAEVWMNGRGWVRVDPTAAVSPQRVQLGAHAAAGATAPWYQSDWLLAARNQLDVVNRVWNSAVVQFSALRQQGLLTPFGVEKAEYSHLMAVLIAASTLLLGLFAWMVLRVPRATHDTLDAAYARLCRKLARAGMAPQATEGPISLTARAGTLWPQHQELSGLLADYARLRYAFAAPPAGQVQVFARATTALRLPAVQPNALSSAT